jgi:hypothetical protein
MVNHGIEPGNCRTNLEDQDQDGDESNKAILSMACHPYDVKHERDSHHPRELASNCQQVGGASQTIV